MSHADIRRDLKDEEVAGVRRPLLAWILVTGARSRHYRRGCTWSPHEAAHCPCIPVRDNIRSYPRKRAHAFWRHSVPRLRADFQTQTAWPATLPPGVPKSGRRSRRSVL